MWVAVLACALWAGLTAVLAHRGGRVAVVWGALWGVAAGFWAVAPLVIRVHFLRPAGVVQWAILDGFFLVAFALLGAALTLLASGTIGVWVLVWRRPLRNPAWAYATWAAITLPVAYIGASTLIELTEAGGAPSLGTYESTLRQPAGAYVVAVAALLTLYHWRAARGWDPRGRVLASALAASAVTGCLLLPFRRALPGVSARDRAAPLERQSLQHPRSPLLVIGLDGGNWQTLGPLIEQGKAPTFARLVSAGLRGETPALWPPYWSTPAWGAIVTGHSQDEIGVHEDLSAVAPGLPAFELPLTFNLALDPLFVVEFGLTTVHLIEAAPPSRGQLLWPPVWERLSRAGEKVAVIRFPFTYPAPGQAAYVISNRVVTDLWGGLSVREGRRDDLVAPAAERDRWLATFANDRDVAPALLARLLPRRDWPKPADAIMDPVDVLRRATATEEAMHQAAMSIVRQDRALGVVMVHIAGFDEVCHAFWQYRFPDEFPEQPPSPADVAALGGVIDRYLELVDERVGELIDAFDAPPNVLVVSDHGEGPAPFHTIWRGWHASPGVFLAAGPDIPHAAQLLQVSYYDITPTVLDLVGFDKPGDLRGRSVLDAR